MNLEDTITAVELFCEHWTNDHITAVRTVADDGTNIDAPLTADMLRTLIEAAKPKVWFNPHISTDAADDGTTSLTMRCRLTKELDAIDAGWREHVRLENNPDRPA